MSLTDGCHLMGGAGFQMILNQVSKRVGDGSTLQIPLQAMRLVYVSGAFGASSIWVSMLLDNVVAPVVS